MHMHAAAYFAAAASKTKKSLLNMGAPHGALHSTHSAHCHPPPTFPPAPQALDQLVRQQSVTCTFDAFARAFPTSAPVLALSHSRSLLREAFATVLPLQPAAAQQQQAAPALAPQQLDLVRDYLMAAQVGAWLCCVAMLRMLLLSTQALSICAACLPVHHTCLHLLAFAPLHLPHQPLLLPSHTSTC